MKIINKIFWSALILLVVYTILVLVPTSVNFSITGFVAEGRLPTVGGDSGNWGSVLNTYLTQEHTAEGGHKNVTVQGSLDVDGNGNFTGNLNVTGNLTIGDKITFRLGGVIDNLVDGIIRVTGNLNVTDVLILNPQINPSTSVEGSIFYNSSLSSIMVYNGSLWVIPGVKNEIKYFNDTSCPPGWGEMQEAVGRYFVAINTTGTLGATVGTALTNTENRAVGQHNHLQDPHSHSVSHDATKLFGSHGGGAFPSAEAAASITIGDTTATNQNTGSIAGTNAPYIQLLVCVKT